MVMCLGKSVLVLKNQDYKIGDVNAEPTPPNRREYLEQLVLFCKFWIEQSKDKIIAHYNMTCAICFLLVVDNILYLWRILRKNALNSLPVNPDIYTIKSPMVNTA